MPNLGNGINSLNDLERDEYAWSTLPKDKLKDHKDLILINQDEIFTL